MSNTVLIVEDNRSLALALAAAAERNGLSSELAPTLAIAREVLARETVCGILLDVGLPDGRGFDLLKGNTTKTLPPVAVITAHGELENAMDARRLQVTQFFNKPLDFEELESFFQSLHQPLPVGERLSSPAAFIGAAPAMQSVFHQIAQACVSREPLVIRGSHGTGKTHLSQLIARYEGADFQVIHVSEALTEEELKAVIELVGAGTLILESIHSLHSDLQKILVRCFDEILPQERPRFIVTCDEGGLRELVEKGVLDENLYYRLQVLDLCLPSLSERASDIPALVAAFLGELGQSRNLTVADEVLILLQEAEWAGNVRELRNVVSYAVIASHGSSVICPKHLPAYFEQDRAALKEGASANAQLELFLESWLEELDLENLSYRQLIGRVEKALLEKLLVRFEQKPSHLAKAMDLNRSTLRKRLRFSDE